MPRHEPVMTREVLAYLEPEKGGVFVDCTVGMGGHTRALIEAGAARVIGIDRDRDALAEAGVSLAAYGARVEFVHSDYRQIAAVLDRLHVERVDGVLADMGISSFQLDTPQRGFSFQHDAPLDMRMDTSQGATAADLVASATEAELADVIYQYGEERYSRRIARWIVQARSAGPIVSTAQLAALVRQAVPRRGYSRIDPATRTFQALRIWVNRELDGIDEFLRTVVRRLKRGGRLVVLTFHSLEDRIVKHTLRDMAHADRALVRLLTKKPVTPQPDELDRNPRARSAKLRAAECISEGQP